MLNIELIQSDTENVRASLIRRGEAAPIDELVSLDNKRKFCLLYTSPSPRD